MSSGIHGDSVRARVLIVEDLPSQQASLRRMLKRLGYGVAATNDGKRALEMLRSEHFDLVCMDVGLPRESGYQVCEMIRDDPALCDVGVLLMDDRASPLDRARAYESGAHGYLIKPFCADELEEELDRLMSGERSSDRIPTAERAR